MSASSQAEAKLNPIDLWQVLRNRYGIILLTFFLVFLTSAIITYIMPRQYLGAVQLEVEEAGPDLTVFDPGGGKFNQFNSYRFLETQFEIITSKKTLYKVIDQLGLQERWGINNRTKTYNSLRGKIDANSMRNTELIEIEVFSSDPNEAAEIANAVADSYRIRRTEEEEARSKNAIKALDSKYEEARHAMEQARAHMLDVMEKYGIVDLMEGARGGRPGVAEVDTGEKSLYFRAKSDLYELEISSDQLKSNIDTLSNLDGEDLVKKAASLQLQDDTLRRRYQEYIDLQLAEQSLLDAGLGRKHPTVVGARNQLDKLAEICRDAAQNVKESLQTQLAMNEKNRENARDKSDDRKESAISSKRVTLSYEEAKNKYELARELMASLKNKLETTRIDSLMPRTPIIVHAVAEPAENPAKPKFMFNLMLGGVLGLLSGLGLALFLEYADTSVKSLEDVEHSLGVPVLAVVPTEIGILHKQSGASPDAEAYRILRTNIEFNRKSQHLNAINVVSGGAGEGKSTTLVNLAYICAQGGYTTLIIDADLRRPRVHTFFDISNTVGLTNYLSTDVELEDVVLQTPIDNLYFLPSGILPADAAGILNSKRMSELLADVKSRFDLVFVDSPPILGVSDASVICSEVDHTIIVIQYRKLPKKMLLRVKQAVESVGGNILGAVLNNVDIRGDSQYQYYTSYYTYYSPTKSASYEAETVEATTYDESAMSDVGANQASVADGGGVSESETKNLAQVDSAKGTSTDGDDIY